MIETETQTPPQAERYPVDVAALIKGDYITPEEIARIERTTPGTNPHNLVVMQLCQYIEQRSIELERPLLARCHRDGIRVLTDVEAVEHTQRGFDSGIKKMKTSIKRMTVIDDRQLNSEQVIKHSTQLKRDVLILSATERERRRAWKTIPSAQEHVKKRLPGAES